MKKLITVTLLAGCIAGASAANAYAQPFFSDTAASAQLQNAVKELADNGVLDGYEDGTFRPENPVTRAEAVKLITAFIGADGGQNSGFDDMEGHWADRYVGAAAKDYGFVHGFEDNTFRPDAEVTAAQFVTMLLCAAGDEDKAAAAGGYPNGYMVLARENHLFDETGMYTDDAKPLNRGDAALILHKAAEVRLIGIPAGTRRYLTEDKPSEPQPQYFELPDEVMDKILADPDKYTITMDSAKEPQGKNHSAPRTDFVPLDIPEPKTDDYVIDRDRLIIGDDYVYGKFILDDSFKNSWVYDVADKEGDVTIGVTLVDKKKAEINDTSLYIGINPMFDDSVCRNGNALCFYPKHNVEDGAVIRNTSGWENDTALAVRLINGTMEIFLTDRYGEVKSNIIASKKGITSGERESAAKITTNKESQIYLTGQYSSGGKSYKIITYSGKQQGYDFSGYDKARFLGTAGDKEAVFTVRQIYRNAVYMGDILLFEYADGTGGTYMWTGSDGENADFIKVTDSDVRPLKYDMRTVSRIEYTDSNPTIRLSASHGEFNIGGKSFRARQTEAFSQFMENVFAAGSE